MARSPALRVRILGVLAIDGVDDPPALQER
jgi:hypothetical protein